MQISDKWEDYELLDIDRGEKLERWKDIIFIRPDPQVIFASEKRSGMWNDAHARYVRSTKGGGSWEYFRNVPERWVISYSDMSFYISPTNFKHTGLFPEQAANWDWFRKKIRESGRKPNILNLFAYTGGATIACLLEGASVCHLDASKGIMTWARENIKLSGLSDRPVRYIVDDAYKFVMREKRRGRSYDGIIMDPPSYGRGPKGEIWKTEDDLYTLIKEAVGLLSDDALFFHINSYTAGYSPVVFKDMLIKTAALKMKKGSVECDEVVLPVSGSELLLPCGVYARWES